MRCILLVRLRILYFTIAFVLVVSCTVWAEQADFESWLAASEQERAQDTAEFIESVRQRGLIVVYDGLREELARMPQATLGSERERDWIRRFLMVMDRTKRPADLSLLEEEPLDADNQAVTGRLKSVLRDQFTGNPFVPEEGRTDPNYYIFKDDKDGLQITITPEETSVVAKALWLRAQMLNGMFNDENLRLMIASHQTIAESKQRWTNFMDSVLSDQFPWETLVNGWIWEGTLAQPPKQQLRLVHPLPVMVANIEGEAAFKPRIGIEGVGVRFYSSPTYNPKIGVSFLSILPGNEDENLGYGVLISMKRFSFGGVWQDMEREDASFALVAGVELADFFENTWNDLSSKVNKIHQKLDDIEYSVATP